MSGVTEFARAKINLTLEVLGKRPDGYHELRSVVAFADFGDTITFTPSGRFELLTTGPMAESIEGPNLIEKAAALMAGILEPDVAHPACASGRFDLVKRIPVAAGLGGGSADAAAAMRAIMRTNPHLKADRAALRAAALKVGADVPVCLAQTTAFMAGVGEALTDLPETPSYPALLVNPGVKLSTRDVFTALAAKPLAYDAETSDEAAERLIESVRANGWASYLLSSRNDLEPPARRLAPEIDEVLARLSTLPGCWLARLSGSGPTCFALFETAGQANEAAKIIHSERPKWWLAATQLG